MDDEKDFMWTMMCQMIPMQKIDEFIASLDPIEDRHWLDDLTELRQDMKDAYMAGNLELAVARGETLDARCALYGLKMYARPLHVRSERQSEAIRQAQPKGVQATKARAADRRKNLETAIGDYIANYPHALVRGIDGLLSFLQERNLTFGYKNTSIEQYAKPLFAAARKKAKR